VRRWFDFDVGHCGKSTNTRMLVVTMILTEMTPSKNRNFQPGGVIIIMCWPKYKDSKGVASVEQVLLLDQEQG
jgi:hypothetical protein